MILHIDWHRWRELPLSHKTRHVYLNLVVLTQAVPARDLNSFRKRLKLGAGQWHAVKGELRQAGLLSRDKLKLHSSVLLTVEKKSTNKIIDGRQL